VEIDVDDTGPGVAPDERDRIFAPLSRGAAGRQHAGLGLGLAIARRAVAASGGQVAVDSSDLGGARFTLAVPAS